jgi:hypothetical protein
MRSDDAADNSPDSSATALRVFVADQIVIHEEHVMDSVGPKDIGLAADLFRVFGAWERRVLQTDHPGSLLEGPGVFPVRSPGKRTAKYIRHPGNHGVSQVRIGLRAQRGEASSRHRVVAPQTVVPESGSCWREIGQP